MKPGQILKSAQSKFSLEIKTIVNCQTQNLIYLINCKKCPTQYVGTIQARFSEHLGYVKNKHTNKITQTGSHFNSTGHRQSDMEISIIEKIHSTSEQYRKQTV